MNFDDLAQNALVSFGLHSQLTQNALGDFNELHKRKLKAEEILILYYLMADGGKAERPSIWKRVNMDSKKYSSIANRLKSQGLIRSRRTESRESIDEITAEGERVLEHLKENLKLHIVTLFSVLKSTERQKIATGLQSIGSVSSVAALVLANAYGHDSEQELEAEHGEIPVPAGQIA